MTAVATRQEQSLNVTPNRVSGETKQAAVVVTSEGAVVVTDNEKVEVQQVGTTVFINGIYVQSHKPLHSPEQGIRRRCQTHAIHQLSSADCTLCGCNVG